MLFIGDDWAEDHYDLEFEDEDGRRLARARLPEGLEGVTGLQRADRRARPGGVARFVA